MNKKVQAPVWFIFAILGAVIMVGILFVMSLDQELKFRSDEEPPIILKMPIKDLDSRIVFDINSAKSAVIIRLVDSTNNEVFFAVLKNIQTESYEDVFEIPPVPMDIFALKARKEGLQLPRDLYVESERFRKIIDKERAKKNLIQVLTNGSKYDRNAEISLKYLKRGYNY